MTDIDRLPMTLPHRNATLVRAGKGRSPGSCIYFDHQRNSQLELYVAKVVTTGPHYAQVEVEGNGALRRVRIDNRHLVNGHARVGAPLLVGGLAYGTDGSIAEFAWPLAVPDKVGTITRIHPNGRCAYAVPDGERAEVFVPGSQLARGMTFRTGLRIRFQVETNDRGPYAVNVRGRRPDHDLFRFSRVRSIGPSFPRFKG